MYKYLLLIIILITGCSEVRKDLFGPKRTWIKAPIQSGDTVYLKGISIYNPNVKLMTVLKIDKDNIAECVMHHGNYKDRFYFPISALNCETCYEYEN